MSLMCSVGDHAILEGDRFYAQVTAWEKPDRGLHGQSGSSLVLRQPTGRIACVRCITSLQNGVDPNQEQLV